MFTYTTERTGHHRLIGFVLVCLIFIVGIGQYLVRMLLTIR